MTKKKRSTEIPLQYKWTLETGHHCIPYGDEAIEKIKEFPVNQVLDSKLTGSKKARSYAQLGLYWACCKTAAELLSDHENILDRRDIDFEVKIRVAKKKPELIRRFKIVSGITYLEPISTSFANMKHLEACRYYDPAMKKIAKMVGMTVEELVAEAKSRMKS
jgi:hypothetical protein